MFMILLPQFLGAIEQPKFKLVKGESFEGARVELRQYNNLQIVQTEMQNAQNRGNSFRKLAGYIGKQNKKQQKIAMTAPVMMTKDQNNNGTMSFVIPKKVVQGGIPEPTNASIELGTIQRGNFATIRFFRSHDRARQADALKKLKAWITKEKLTAIGEPIYAFYNPPWTPEFMRTNEIWLRVK